MLALAFKILRIYTPQNLMVKQLTETNNLLIIKAGI